MNERIAQLVARGKGDSQSTAKWMIECDEHMVRMYELKAEVKSGLGAMTLLETLMDVMFAGVMG